MMFQNGNALVVLVSAIVTGIAAGFWTKPSDGELTHGNAFVLQRNDREMGMHGLRFGLHLTGLPVPDLVEAGVLADKCGFDSIWVPDHFTDLPPSGDMMDPWVVLSAIGARSSHVMLSTDVTDVLRCHPTKTAHIVATLDELTGGRAALGVGAGELMNLGAFGLPWEDPGTRVARLREAIQVIRLMWKSSRSNPVNFKGRFYSLDEAWLDQKCVQLAPPIYVGALGARRMLRLVGELADGWKPWLNTPETFKRGLEVIEGAAKKAGRDLDAIDKVAFVHVAVTDDSDVKKKAIDAMKPEITCSTHRRLLRELGFEVPIPIQAVYRYQKSPPTEEIAAFVSRAGESMPDDVAERFLCVGTLDEVVAGIERFVQAGATHIVVKDIVGLYLLPSLNELSSTVKIFGQKILPYVEGS